MVNHKTRRLGIPDDSATGETALVDHVSSAEAAFTYLNDHLPDLMIVDYRLPGVHGDEICRSVRLNFSTSTLPVLMLTAAEEAEYEEKALEAGADDFVNKSDEGDVLLARIQALLRRPAVERREFGLQRVRFNRPRLLVVEDSATFREYVVSGLRVEGYEVSAVASAEEALDRLEWEGFDGVLVDVGLPEMDGFELCRRLDTQKAAQRVPFVILVLTGHEDIEVMMRALSAGADDVICKTRSPKTVNARLRALLRRRSIYDGTRQILDEFREQERAVIQAESERRAAEERAALADELARANQELEATNRELKETQSQLVQSAKMASIGQLVAGIAHEVNNPLSFVMSHLSTIERNFEKIAANVAEDGPDAKAVAKVRERLTDVHMGLERVKDLVLKLRTFSRLDEGEVKTVKVVETIEATLHILAHRMKGRIELVTDFQGPETITCYPGPFNQVVMNLVSNAIDAIDGEGEIRLSTARENDNLRLTVSDTGSGIPDHIRDRIFDPFFTTKGVGEGTGLGLSISYGIVRDHGGTISAVNREGGGTEMIVELPVAVSEKARQ